mgnify:CR=1 FL=1
MSTRTYAKNSQLIKIRCVSSNVKKNFYELWKFAVDLGF